ncbi:hypothetical protein [Celerinatantimonas sp. MCCC 1A17872]|uniref:hypothetical protein n=1 Tax=Celerinatantimonas sp. MCCC 1A17872 TaxID=3177514 RepID=UPI0038C318A1
METYKKLPLVNPYPFFYSKKSNDYLDMEDHLGKVDNYNKFISLWDKNLSVTGPLKNKIKRSREYKTWQKIYNGLSRSSLIDGYRCDGFPKLLWSDLIKEINDNRYHLSPNQTIFHGGYWPTTGIPTVGEKFSLNRPLSTTLNPDSALWHSKSDYDEEDRYRTYISLIILHVANDSNFCVHVYDNEKNENEMEVLIVPNATIQCQSITPIQLYIDPNFSKENKDELTCYLIESTIR